MPGVVMHPLLAVWWRAAVVLAVLVVSAAVRGSACLDAVMVGTLAQPAMPVLVEVAVAPSSPRIDADWHPGERWSVPTSLMDRSSGHSESCGRALPGPVNATAASTVAVDRFASAVVTPPPPTLPLARTATRHYAVTLHERGLLRM